MTSYLIHRVWRYMDDLSSSILLQYRAVNSLHSFRRIRNPIEDIATPVPYTRSNISHPYAIRHASPHISSVPPLSPYIQVMFDELTAQKITTLVLSATATFMLAFTVRLISSRLHPRLDGGYTEIDDDPQQHFQHHSPKSNHSTKNIAMTNKVETVSHHGKCHCQRVRFRFRGPSELHALDYGSPSTSQQTPITGTTASVLKPFPHVLVPAEDFEWIADAHALTTSPVEEFDSMMLISCVACGTNVVRSSVSSPATTSTTLVQDILLQVPLECIDTTHVARIHHHHHHLTLSNTVSPHALAAASTSTNNAVLAPTAIETQSFSARLPSLLIQQQQHIQVLYNEDDTNNDQSRNGQHSKRQSRRNSRTNTPQHNQQYNHSNNHHTPKDNEFFLEYHPTLYESSDATLPFDMPTAGEPMQDQPYFNSSNLDTINSHEAEEYECDDDDDYEDEDEGEDLDHNTSHRNFALNLQLNSLGHYSKQRRSGDNSVAHGASFHTNSNHDNINHDHNNRNRRQSAVHNAKNDTANHNNSGYYSGVTTTPSATGSPSGRNEHFKYHEAAFFAQPSVHSPVNHGSNSHPSSNHHQHHAHHNTISQQSQLTRPQQYNLQPLSQSRQSTSSSSLLFPASSSADQNKSNFRADGGGSAKDSDTTEELFFEQFYAPASPFSPTHQQQAPRNPQQHRHRSNHNNHINQHHHPSSLHHHELHHHGNSMTNHDRDNSNYLQYILGKDSMPPTEADFNNGASLSTPPRVMPNKTYRAVSLIHEPHPSNLHPTHQQVSSAPSVSNNSRSRSNSSPSHQSFSHTGTSSPASTASASAHSSNNAQHTSARFYNYHGNQHHSTNIVGPGLVSVDDKGEIVILRDEYGDDIADLDMILLQHSEEVLHQPQHSQRHIQHPHSRSGSLSSLDSNDANMKQSTAQTSYPASFPSEVMNNRKDERDAGLEEDNDDSPNSLWERRHITVRKSTPGRVYKSMSSASYQKLKRPPPLQMARTAVSYGGYPKNNNNNDTMADTHNHNNNTDGSNYNNNYSYNQDHNHNSTKVTPNHATAQRSPFSDKVAPTTPLDLPTYQNLKRFLHHHLSPALANSASRTSDSEASGSDAAENASS